MLIRGGVEKPGGQTGDPRLPPHGCTLPLVVRAVLSRTYKMVDQSRWSLRINKLFGSRQNLRICIFDMAIELRGNALISIILLASGLDFLLFGFDQGLFGGVLAGEGFKEMLGNPSATRTGLVTAIYDIGCALGAVMAFLIGDKVGRKKSIVYANIIVIIGAAIQTASYSYAQMSVARVIAGIGVGFSTVAVPILQSETLPSRNRGAVSTDRFTK